MEKNRTENEAVGKEIQFTASRRFSYIVYNVFVYTYSTRILRRKSIFGFISVGLRQSQTFSNLNA